MTTVHPAFSHSQLSTDLGYSYVFGEEDIRIEIQDNGTGMDEKTRKRVFEPFYTTRGVGKGTGLGLSVSYFIIKKNHNGEMAVQSVPGEGTTFIIKLPIKGGGR